MSSTAFGAALRFSWALFEKQNREFFLVLEVLQQSRDFSRLLQEKKIPHEYREQPGIHEWPLWDHQIQEVLRLMAERWELEGGQVAVGRSEHAAFSTQHSVTLPRVVILSAAKHLLFARQIL